MKKLTAVVLTLALALALAGCGEERTAYVEAQSVKAEGYDAVAELDRRLKKHYTHQE